MVGGESTLRLLKVDVGIDLSVRFWVSVVSILTRFVGALASGVSQDDFRLRCILKSHNVSIEKHCSREGEIR